MHPALLHARRLGYVLLRDSSTEGARLDPPFLRYNPNCDPDKLAAAIEGLCLSHAKAVEHRT